MKSTPYHHGALRDGLLAAAEAVLRRDGLAGMTLRAAAREAGVSHAAPTHHFGDLTGLLTALAADGFRRFGEALRAAVTAPDAQRWDGARAYIAFALANPALFQLMFRTDRLDDANPALREARLQALQHIAAARRMPATDLSVAQLGEVLGGWALVHGYTLLLLDGRLAGLPALGPAGTTPDALLDAMFAAADAGRAGPRQPD
jgi:AcrR family transcriptional regulator